MQVAILIGVPQSERHQFTDITQYCRERSFRLNRTAYSQIDSININVEQPLGTTISNLAQGSDIIVEELGNPENRLFGGVISSLEISMSGLDMLFSVRGVDWTFVLDKTTVRRNYETSNQTDQDIIRKAIEGTEKGEAGLTEFDLNGVTEGRAIEAVRFQGQSCSDVLNQICAITGFIWFVTPKKEVIYKSRTLGAASVHFSDSPSEPTTYPIQNLTVSRSLGGLNKIEVRGGGGLSDDQTITFAGDGSTTLFHLTGEDGKQNITSPPVGYEVIRVYVNTGSNASPTWTEKTVTNEGLGGLATDCDWNPLEGTLKFDTAPPNFANGFRVIGRYRTQVIVIADDRYAQENHGRVYMNVVRVTEATKPSHAHEVALSLLRDNTDQVTLNFTTNYELAEPGTMGALTHAGLGYTSEPFLIQSVSTSIIGGTTTASVIQGVIINKDFYT